MWGFFKRKQPMLNRLAYFSMADPNLTPQDVVDIVNTAQRINARHNVTGALIYNGRQFFQILEGAPEDVGAIYTAVRADKRHYNVQTVFDLPAQTRACGDWSMLLINPLNSTGTAPPPPGALEPELARMWRSFGTLR